LEGDDDELLGETQTGVANSDEKEMVTMTVQ
jgi:hypothetical protein